jgi:hypothetical protein
MTQEGDVVALTAEFLRSSDWTVLVARPNQVRVFFTMPYGRRKGPDLIAVRDDQALAMEAKVKVASLLTGRPTSDVEAMTFLSGSFDAQNELLSKVMVDTSAVQVRAGVVAAEVPSEPTLARVGGLLVFHADLETRSVRVVHGALEP